MGTGSVGSSKAGLVSARRGHGQSCQLAPARARAGARGPREMDTATGSDVATEVASAAVPAASAAEVVSQLRSTFRSGRTRSLDWRRQQLAGIEKFVAERESEIARALQEDLGRPSFYAWLGDIAGSAAEAAFARKNVSRWARRTRVSL